MVEKFTPRERDVLRLMVQGLNYAEMADELKMGVRTVQTHLIHIYGKLNARNRTEAVVMALGTHIELDDAKAAVRARYEEATR